MTLQNTDNSYLQNEAFAYIAIGQELNNSFLNYLFLVCFIRVPHIGFNQ